MKPNVQTVMRLMEKLAPSRLAEDWDNTGLLIGSRSWPVSKILAALDPTLQTVIHAAKNGYDMIITHHPVIFSPIKSIDFDTPLGRIIGLCHDKRISVFAAHTNLDSTKGGVNDVLAERLGLQNCSVFIPEASPPLFKLVVYVPEEAEGKVLAAYNNTGKGVIGNYNSCAFRSKGTGSFFAREEAKPFNGDRGMMNEARESKLEFTLGKQDLSLVLKAVLSVHPYETPAYDIYPLKADDSAEGLGRIGELPEKSTLAELAIDIKKNFGLPALRYAGNPSLSVKKIAICTGSGSSLMKNFFRSDADVYISGDLGHHNAIDVAESNRGLIDLGHFTSERIVLDSLCMNLRDLISKDGVDILIAPYEMEENPFKTV